jgi:hypothetical protein
MVETIGPNVKRLITRKMSLDAIPRGGGFVDGLAFLSRKENITEGAKNASLWVKAAIRIVRQAAEPNPWKDADDEAIASYLLEQITERDRLNNLPPESH